MLNVAYDYVVERFPTKASRTAQDSFELYQRSGRVQTRLWGQYAFADGDIWTSNLVPTVHRYFHSWIFMGDWITLATQDHRALTAVTRVADLWIERFSSISHEDPIFRRAYHDEGTAQRVRHALRLHHILENHSSTFDRTKNDLEKMLTDSAQLLQSDGFYSGLNNHGMFQSLSLRDLASYATWLDSNIRLELLKTANNRLFEYFDEAYTTEGVHIEHSPSYHLMVLRDVAEHSQFLRTIRYPKTQLLDDIIANATEHTIHCVLPNGVFLPLSDTQQIPLTNSSNNVADSSTFEYAVTAGSKGRKPSTRTLSEKTSGYFIHRSAWGTTDARFIAFIAAYNGNYHKHSDDLHLYLWDRGHELLSESGPFGYNSKDPYVRYGFSQWAHNNIVIDGKSLPRVDGKFDAVGITEIHDYSDTLSVQGFNKRHPNVVHTRTINLDDSISHIQVIDELESDAEHEYTLNWNIGPTVDIEIVNNTVIGRIDNNIAFILSVTTDGDLQIRHYRGKTGHQPMGWRFPRMNEKVPSSLVSFIINGSTTSLTTTIDVLKPAGYSEGLAVSRPELTSHASPPTSQTIAELGHPLEPRVSPGSVSITNIDKRFTRAVIKLFDKNGLYSTKSGLIKNISWFDLPSGAYRLRFFPKHETLVYPPYTSDWFQV